MPKTKLKCVRSVRFWALYLRDGRIWLTGSYQIVLAWQGEGDVIRRGTFVPDPPEPKRKVTR